MIIYKSNHAYAQSLYLNGVPVTGASTPGQYLAGVENNQQTREITLTIGVFFDGTSNNAFNTQSMLKLYATAQHELSDLQAGNILATFAHKIFGVSGVNAASYSGYYTNIYWLSRLYYHHFSAGSQHVQRAVYIEGIGTEAGKPDSSLGQGLGLFSTGIIAKTDKVITQLPSVIQEALNAVHKKNADRPIVIKALQFDIFGFSRGAAAARHFANRIQAEDPAIIRAVRQGVVNVVFNGSACGKTRFIGLFDTVAAVGMPGNGLNPHSADTGDVQLVLRPGVADSVFHITAANECRFNFALNSVKPAWPELSLPGSHSDIGGGYLPVIKEDLFLTRPVTQTVPLNHPGEQTTAWRQAAAESRVLSRTPFPGMLLEAGEASVETWFDDRLPPDRYGQMQKRSYAALTLRGRIVKNDWSRVALRVMLDAAQEAGAVFDPIDAADPDMTLAEELIPLCDKALVLGRALRRGEAAQIFNQQELGVILKKYSHCSAHWNVIPVNEDGLIAGGALPSELIGFINRPDEQWQRTVYDMDGRRGC